MRIKSIKIEFDTKILWYYTIEWEDGTCSEHGKYDTANFAIKRLQQRIDFEQEKMIDDPWIEVEDKMPEKNQEVWYYFEELGTFGGWYVGDGCFCSPFGWLGGGEVTHWKPRYPNDYKPSPPIMGEF